MTIVRTNLGAIESARRVRFEPTGTIASTNVQKAVEEVATDAAALVAAAFNPVDLFIVAGDSNAVGQGSSASSPIVQSGTVLQYSAAGAISTANDPTLSAVNAARNANTGSSWPSFGNAYYRATGRKVGLVLTGLSGSFQTAAADTGVGNWDTTGTLFTDAINAYNLAVTAFSAAGYSPSLKGVILHLGANDAARINLAVITGGQYQTAFTDMLARWRSTLGVAHLPIYVIQTGTNLSVSDAGYATVRSTQITVVNADPDTHFGFINTYDFLARGMMSSGAHPNQAGYNETGDVLAANIISAQSRIATQRNGYDAYFSFGNFAVGYPVADAPLSVNPNLAAAAKSPPTNAPFHFTGVSGAVQTGVFDGYGGSLVIAGRTSLGTISAPLAVTADTLLMAYAGRGYNGSDFQGNNTAFLGFYAAETHSGTAAGSYARINTTPNTTTTNAEVIRFENDGGVTVPSTVTGGSKGAGTLNATQIYRAGTALATVATSASAADLSAGTLPAGRMPALTGDVTTSAGAVATTIANDAVSNAKLANVNTSTIKGRVSASTGDPEDLTVAQAQALLLQTQQQIATASVNFNSANTDTTINLTAPTGFTRYSVRACGISGASASLTTATCGLFTSSGGGGTAIVTGGSAITVSTASEGTNNNMQFLTVNNPNSQTYTNTQLFFRVANPQGSAATGTVTLTILWIS